MNTPNGNFIEKSIPNTKNATLSVNIGGVDSTISLFDSIFSGLTEFSRLRINNSYDGSNGLTVINTSPLSNAGSQVLLVNDTGMSGQWYSAGSGNGYIGSNTLLLRQMKNAPFRFASDNGNIFSFGPNEFGTSPYLVMSSIGTNIPAGLGLGGVFTLNANAILEINSTTKGVLISRMNTGQINGLVGPVDGLTIYNTDIHALCYYNGTTWQKTTTTAM